MTTPSALALLATAAVAPDPHGSRYTAAEREALFQYWRVVGRPLPPAGSPPTSASRPPPWRRWYQEERWPERAAREDAEENAAARASLLARLLPGGRPDARRPGGDRPRPNGAGDGKGQGGRRLCAMAGLVPAQGLDRRARWPRRTTAGPASRSASPTSSQLTPQELAAFRDRGEVPPRFHLGPPELPPGA